MRCRGEPISYGKCGQWMRTIRRNSVRNQNGLEQVEDKVGEGGPSTGVNVKNMDLVVKKLSGLYFCSAKIWDG